MDTINTIFHNLLGGLLAYVLIVIALVAGAIAIVKFTRNRNTIGSNNTFNASINQQTGDGNINNKDKV